MDTEGIFNLSNDTWQMFDSRQRQAVCPDRLSDSRSGTWGLCPRGWSWKHFHLVPKLKQPPLFHTSSRCICKQRSNFHIDSCTNALLQGQMWGWLCMTNCKGRGRERSCLFYDSIQRHTRYYTVDSTMSVNYEFIYAKVNDRDLFWNAILAAALKEWKNKRNYI
jgi:hypothetical protein